MNRLLKKALAATALFALGAGMAHAKETVVWWDFLSGGDGVRMKALIQKFNEEHPDIQIDATTLEWGVPFYTKVQTSAAVGEGPDVMTYHLSRLPLGVSTNTLREITPEELASAGLKPEDYAPANFQAAQVDGKLYAVPFDIHSLVLYYNKDRLAEAGLIGDDGKPTGLDTLEGFDAALKKLTDGPSDYGLSFQTAGDGGVWRVFYSLLGQQDATFLGEDGVLPGDENVDKATKALSAIANWSAQGWLPKATEYPASVALFTSGKAPLFLNGVWEVPTMVDLAAKNQLGFEWGAIQMPALLGHKATWADSHAFAIPNNVGKEISPEKLKAVLTVIAWMNQNSLAWASAGHIPAYVPVTQTAEFKAMEPNATYAPLAETAVFDPQSVIAGVASPVYEATGNYLVPAVNGEMDPAEAIESFRDDLNGQLP